MNVKKLLPLFALAAAFGQEDEAPRGFSLTSNQTYAPGDKAAVTVFSQGLGSLEFRVYKVADPEKFFLQLEDPHNFGGAAPSLPKDATLLERYRAWKADWRYRLKTAFKEQFTLDTRDRVRQAFSDPPPVRRRLNEASFAQIRILNAKQLIKKFRQPMTKTNPWDSVTVPLDVAAPGIYLVEATNGDLKAYTIACVTSHAMITKTAPGKIVAYVVDRATGAPVANAPVLMRPTRAGAAQAFTTNANGIATGEFPAVETDHILVLAKPNGDFVPSALPGYSFSGRGGEPVKGYVYTERPVYRPGHRVHLRAILREPTKDGYQLPSQSAADIEIQDSDGKTVSRQAGKISSFGTVNADYDVPAGAALGQYAINVKLGEYNAVGSFEVEEYKKPEYFVKVTPAQKRYLMGQTMKAEIEARYFFGEPVKQAKVSYRILRYRYWSPWFAAEDDDEDNPERASWGGEEVSQGTGVLDDDGRLRIEIENPQREFDTLYRVEAAVTDAANRAIDGTGFVTATVGTFLLNVAPDGYVYSPGQTIKAEVEARDYDGKPVVNQRVELRIEDYRYQKDQRLEPRVFGRATGVTGANGKVVVELAAPGNGSYQLHAAAGAVKDSSWLWVNGGFGEDTYRRNVDEIQIIPDKKTYAPGETAKFLILAGKKNAHVLASVEGRDLHSTHHLTAREGSATLEIPIRENFAPNFYVSAAFIQNGTLYQGTKSVKVPPVKQQVQIAVKPSKPEFKPGEKVTYTVETKDWQNKPIATEVALGVVDEAIYSVRPESTPAITPFFYGRVYSVVNTESSLTYYFYGEAGRREMQLAALAGERKALGALKEEPQARPKIRKVFPDTAYWSPALVTGADGKGSVSFNLPDNLTTWRTTARGVTADTRVGQTIDKVLVRKNVMLRTAFPRFFTVGDEVVLKLIVQNTLPTEKRVTMKLDAKGLTLLDGNQREIQVPSKGEGVAEFRVRAGAVLEEAILTGQALTDEESDALEIGLPIRPFGVKMSSGKSGTGAGQVTLNIPAASEARELEISVSPSVAGAMFGALDYLTQFPYGCVEQTMSSFLPNIIVSKALDDLKLKSTQKPAELEAKIQAGVDRLLDFQHPDGGWGWWKTDDSSAFMTALVIEGFARAEEAGRGTPEMKQARDRGAQWLVAELRRERNVTADIRAYMAYALALHSPKERWWADSAREGSLTPHGVAKLGLAYFAIGDGARAAEMAAQLERTVKQDDSQAWWQNDRDGFMDYYYDTTPETTAAAIKLLARINPQNPLLPKTAQWLVANRSGGYYWHSTKQTAIAIDGLTEYLRASNELKPDYRVTVEVNGRNVLDRSFSGADATSPTAVKIRVPANAAGNTIRIAQNGNGRLYWSAQANWFSTDEKQEKAGTARLNLLRDYFRLVPTQRGDRTVYQLEPLAGPVKSGDLLASRLTVTGSNWRYLLIEDPIPAGVETVEKDNLYELDEKPSWWRSWYNRRELRDDRVAIFKTYFDEGQSQFFYLFKVVNPGKFKASPARVQPMYQPAYQATTESKTFEVNAQ